MKKFFLFLYMLAAIGAAMWFVISLCVFYAAHWNTPVSMADKFHGYGLPSLALLVCVALRKFALQSLFK